MVSLQVILILVIIVGTVFGISGRFVSKDVFNEFKDGTIQALWQKVTDIDQKVDKILENSHEHSSSSSN